MPNPAIDIPNLEYRYGAAIDAGDFETAAAMFDHGHLLAEGHRIAGAHAIMAMWRGVMRIYEDGTPRCRHLITNPIIELDAGGETARCHAIWTVLQQVDENALQPVATGGYDDRFAIIDGAWRFTEKHYTGIDLHGDLSGHLIRPAAGVEL
ncbi:MAG: nuclear transport factor 2 family protein [Pseudomonadota bacterium]